MKRFFDKIINTTFIFVAKVLLIISAILGLTYNEVNVIVWYLLLPFIWLIILDCKLQLILFSPIWVVLWIIILKWKHKQFNKYCNILFKTSQKFIRFFGDYCTWSVIICLVIPIIITLILILY